MVATLIYGLKHVGIFSQHKLTHHYCLFFDPTQPIINFSEIDLTHKTVFFSNKCWPNQPILIRKCWPNPFEGSKKGRPNPLSALILSRNCNFLSKKIVIYTQYLSFLTDKYPFLKSQIVIFRSKIVIGTVASP